MEMEVTAEQVANAAFTLFSATTEEMKKPVEQWLNTFRDTRAAWGISEQLVRSPSVPIDIAFFGAMTLQHKVRLQHGCDDAYRACRYCEI